jgi:type IV pili sensor histidine kinase/response regulator
MPLLSACLTTFLCFSIPALAAAQPLVQTGRYTAVAAVPTDAQQEPLQAIVTVEFPESVTTVGDAVRHLLAGTGYALSDVLYWDVEVFGLFNRPLPDVQRTLGPLTVLAALKTLAGSPFRMVVDPVHRLIAFELDPNVRAVGFEVGSE